jgi:hypothetical protein
MKYLILALVLLVTIWGLTRAESGADPLEQSARLCLNPDQVRVVTIDSMRIAVCRIDTGTRYFVRSGERVRIRSYQGVTDLGIVIDSTGAVIEVRILESEDTRSYVNRLKHGGFLRQFNGYRGYMALQPMTGATLTSTAVNETVQRVVAAFAQRSARLRDMM